MRKNCKATTRGRRRHVPDVLPEYDFKNAVRGKYAARYGDRETALLNRVIEAGRLAPAKRRAWLADFRFAHRHHANRQRLISAVEQLWRASAILQRARAADAQAGDVLEANAYAQWEGLLNGTSKLPSGCRERNLTLAQIALLGLLLPRLRERLLEPDAQELLSRLFAEVSRPPNAG